MTIWIWNATLALACLAITGPGVQIVSQGWKDGSESPGAILRDAQVRFQYSSQRASPSDRGLYPESWSQNAGSDNTQPVNIWQEEEIDEVVAGAAGEGREAKITTNLVAPVSCALLLAQWPIFVIYWHQALAP